MDVTSLLSVLRTAEKLKDTTRHCYTSGGRHESVAEHSWRLALVALLPVPPIAFALRAIVRYIRDSDEMQQRIELEAVCIATALVSLLYLAGGFLQTAKVIDLPAGAVLIWLFPLVCLTYGLAKVVVARRYR